MSPTAVYYLKMAAEYDLKGMHRAADILRGIVEQELLDAADESTQVDATRST